MQSAGRNVEEQRDGEGRGGSGITGVPAVSPPHRPANKSGAKKKKREKQREKRQETTETSLRRPKLIAHESSIHHSLFLQKRASSSGGRWVEGGGGRGVSQTQRQTFVRLLCLLLLQREKLKFDCTIGSYIFRPIPPTPPSISYRQNGVQACTKRASTHTHR